MKTLIIMRGVPGSGKSTLAAAIAASHNNPDGQATPIFSTDDFFMVEGRYVFDGKKLAENHRLNLERTVDALSKGITNVIVDNTNTQAWECREYVRAAVHHGYDVRFVEADTPWARDAEECARRNTHGVPLASIRAMLSRWESDLTVERCLSARAPWER